jgi:hypothetical protein
MTVKTPIQIPSPPVESIVVVSPSPTIIPTMNPSPKALSLDAKHCQFNKQELTNLMKKYDYTDDDIDAFFVMNPDSCFNLKSDQLEVDESDVNSEIITRIPVASQEPVIDVYGGSSSYTKVGSTLYGNDGDTFTKIGNTTFGSDGSTYTQVGSTIFGNDGSTYTNIGNTTFANDGTIYTHIGNTTFGSDGSSASNIGNSMYIYP